MSYVHMPNVTPLKDDRTSARHLSVEASLWVLVVAVSLALRLAQLDAASLTAAEAREATPAWRAAAGQGMPVADYNPLLLAANTLLFGLFGASDRLARLLPALFGSLLVLSPALFRRHLGRIGALAAGLYLAISPTALVASRQLAGTAIAASGAMAFVGGVVRFRETKRRGWLALAAVGLGFAVTSDATAYALLLPLGLAWAVVSRPWLDGQRSRLKDCLISFRPYVPQFALTFLLVLFALCTGLGWNLPGLGAAGGLLVDWLGRFRAVPSPAVSPITLLMVYELLGLTLGIGGLIWGLRQGRQGAALVGLWGGLEVLLLAVMPGRVPTDLLWVVLPLALLLGVSVEALVLEGSPSDGVLRAVHAGLVLVVWAYGYLMIGRYAAFGAQADLALAMLALIVQVLLGLSFGLALGPLVALRTAAAGTGVALVALTLSAGWGVAFRHPADPREPLLSEPTALGIRDLVQTLEDLSWEQTGFSDTLDFVVEAPEDSVVAWYLRDFGGAHRVERLDDVSGQNFDAILVTLDEDSPLPAGVDATYVGQDYVGQGYVGQGFVIGTVWSPRALACRFWQRGCSAAFSWFLFRDAESLPVAVQRATLWRTTTLATAD